MKMSHKIMPSSFHSLRSLALALGAACLLLASNAGAREIRVGIYENAPKIFTNEAGQPDGIFIDILRTIAAKQDWQLSYVHCEWDNCLKQLADGRIDLMPDVASSSERELLFDFHKSPALHSWSQVYVRLDHPLSSFAELSGQRVALLHNSLQEKEFQRLIDGFGISAQIIPTMTMQEAFEFVESGKADAAVANHHYGDFNSSRYGIEATPIIFQPAHLYFASTKRKNHDVLVEIDAQLEEWQQDNQSAYFDILKKWNMNRGTTISPIVQQALLFVTLLFLLTGIVALVLRQRLRNKTSHLLAVRDQLTSTLDALPDLMFEIDQNGRYLSCHSPRNELYAAPVDEMIGKTLHDVLPSSAADTCMLAIQEANENGTSQGKQIELQLADGSHWFELSVACKHIAKDQLPSFIVLSRDITPRKQAEKKLARLTKLYAALSQCNQAIVRCTDKEQLFPQICKDVVDFGGMKMAWIGMWDEPSKLVKPVASFGVGIEYLEGLEISTDPDGPKGRGPTGTALRENRPYWCQDFQRAPETAAWHERGARFGWGSSAALPILCQDKVVGAFTLYASEVDAFDEAAQNLLVEMSLDISYALDRFALEAEKNVTESNYQHLFHSMISGFAMHEIICDAQGNPVDYRFLEANPAFYELTGLSEVKLIGSTVLEVIPNLEPFWIERYGHVALSGESTKFVYPVAILGRHFEVIAYSPEKGKFATLFTDVTERINSELALAIQARRAEALLTMPIDAEKMDEREFMTHGADLAEQLTESQIAFVHLVYEDQVTIELGSWSQATQATYCHAAFDNHYPIDEAGVWADALRQRKPVIINDYETATGKHELPEGHAHLERLISVPVMEGGLVRMMVGVGNKTEDYSDLDVETVQLVANTIWRIVQQRRAEIALKQSEDIFNHFMDNSPIYVFFKDENIRALRLSKNYERLVGKPMSEMIGKNMEELFPSELAKKMIEDDKKILSEGKTITVEEELNGRSYSTIKFPILLEGKPTYLAGYTTDITEKKSQDESLRRLTQAVEQSPITVVITDLAANIVYANSTFTKVTGYTLEEALGKNPRILQSGHTPKATYDDMWAHLSAGIEWRGELINRTKDGMEYIESALISPVRQPDGMITHYLAIKQNITEARQNEQRIQQLAHFDHLTGLPNRSLLNERFSYALSLAQRSGESLAVMFLDLDHFKNINDTLGHSVGDRFLLEVATRLKAAIRDEDTVSRLGGDEFILVFPGTDADAAAIVASKLMHSISQPYQIDHHELIGTPSIGIAIYPHDGKNFEDLLKNADTAMYRVKQDSRNDFRFFTAEMQSHSERNLQLVNAMRHALARNEFHLQYQPQVTLGDGHIIGAEALLRWDHPELGSISPAEFITIAEDSGQIIPIGEWVLRNAVKQMKDWLDRGLPPMVMAVNLSAVQFRHPNLPEVVTRILEEAQLPAEYLELELTEAVAMDDPQSAVAVMDDLSERGIRMSIDDFGTGYSSLSYLKRFKVYKLKIDQSFVRNISDDPEDKAIVTAIINLASSLGMHTIAEGVETAGQLAFLRLQGCDEVQGYYFSKPLPSVQFEAFVRKQTGK
jgi:diguanylate cyclase (GGDEF)-like protein/PAS domain S-box-containing protein